MSQIKNPKIHDKEFGLLWIESTACWRMALGNKNHAGDDPWAQEYFSVAQYGSKKLAGIAARARRDEVMATPAFRRYFKHCIDGRRIKAPRSTGTTGVTGIVFARGVNYRKGNEYVSPSFRVYIGTKHTESYALRSLTAYRAFHQAAKSRFKAEKRRYTKSAVDALFEAWANKPDVSRFLAQHDIPLRPAT